MILKGKALLNLINTREIIDSRTGNPRPLYRLWLVGEDGLMVSLWTTENLTALTGKQITFTLNLTNKKSGGYALKVVEANPEA